MSDLIMFIHIKTESLTKVFNSKCNSRSLKKRLRMTNTTVFGNNFSLKNTLIFQLQITSNNTEYKLPNLTEKYRLKFILNRKRKI